MKIAATIQGIITLLFLLANPGFGTDLPKPFASKDGFTIYLPTNWKPIPKEVLDKYSQAIAKMAPLAEKQFYDAGFQRTDTLKWFSYPYILVQVRRSGRIPEDQLEALKPIDKAIDDSFEKATDALSSITSNASLGESIYDPVSHILWTRIAIDVKDAGTVRGIIGAVLTEEGFVQIACYAKGNDFEKYLPVFESVINNTAIRADLRYQARNRTENRGIDDLEPSSSPWITTTLIFTGILLLFLIGRRRRNKTSGT